MLDIDFLRTQLISNDRHFGQRLNSFSSSNTSIPFWTQMTRKNSKIFIPLFFLHMICSISFMLSNVKIKIFLRYNLTHFHDRSGIIALNELKRKLNTNDNYFEDHVVSNLGGKLRNRNIQANCFCRKVHEPFINNHGSVILIW